MCKYTKECPDCGKKIDYKSLRCKSCYLRLVLSRRKGKFISCAICNVKVYKDRSRLLASKHKIYFCSRACKDKSLGSFGIKKVQPRHYGTGHTGYRRRAFGYLKPRCSVCGYKIKEVLRVHHKDGNRKNSKLNNLDILCPTHHEEYHLGIRKYRNVQYKYRV